MAPQGTLPLMPQREAQSQDSDVMLRRVLEVAADVVIATMEDLGLKAVVIDRKSGSGRLLGECDKRVPDEAPKMFEVADGPAVARGDPPRFRPKGAADQARPVATATTSVSSAPVWSGSVSSCSGGAPARLIQKLV